VGVGFDDRGSETLTYVDGGFIHPGDGSGSDTLRRLRCQRDA
jgi:hypothetical protein